MSNAASILWARVTSGESIYLPASGVTVTLKPVSLTSLIRRGIVPSSLFGEAMLGYPELDSLKEASTPADLARMTSLLLDVENMRYAWLSEALVSPKLVDNPREGMDEISMDMLPDEDKEWLLQILQTPIKEWARFRTKLTPDVHAVADEPSVQQEA